MYLKQKNIKNIQTYMDYHLFDQTCHAPDYIQELQTLVKPSMKNFEGKNFVDWSRNNGFKVTPPPGDHPLEEAHIAACELWQDVYYNLLIN